METNTKPLSPSPLVLEVGKAYRDAEGRKYIACHSDSECVLCENTVNRRNHWFNYDGTHRFDTLPPLVSLWDSPSPLVVDAEGWIEAADPSAVRDAKATPSPAPQRTPFDPFPGYEVKRDTQPQEKATAWPGVFVPTDINR